MRDPGPRGSLLVMIDNFLSKPLTYLDRPAGRPRSTGLGCWRREFYTADFPASAMVEVRSPASPGLLIAAEVIAVLGAGKS